MALAFSWILSLCLSTRLSTGFKQEAWSEGWCEKGHACEQMCVDSYTGYYCVCGMGYSAVRRPGRQCTDCHRQLDAGIIIHGDFNSLSLPNQSNDLDSHLFSVFSHFTIAKRKVQVAVTNDCKIASSVTPDYNLFIKNETLFRQELYRSFEPGTSCPFYTLGAKLDYMKNAFMSQDTGNRYFSPNLAILVTDWPPTGERPGGRGEEDTLKWWSDIVDKASLLEAAGVHIVVLCLISSTKDYKMAERIDMLADLASDRRSVILMPSGGLQDTSATIWRLMNDTMASYCYETQTECFLTEEEGLMCACVTSEGVYPLNGTRCVREQFASGQTSHPGVSPESRGLADSLLHVGWVLTLTNCALVVLLWTYIQLHRSVCTRGR